MSNETTTEPQPSTPSPYEPGDKPAEQLAAEPQPPEATSAAATEQPARYHRPSPYQTGPKPDEIWREHENRVRLGLENASVEEICAEWKVEVPLEFDSPAHGTLS